MKTHLLFVSMVAALLIAAPSVLAQFPTPTPPIPITVTSISVTKLRTFAPAVEVETSLGRITGTGTLEWGPTICTIVNPCLSGTLMNTALKLSGLTGSLNGQNVNFRVGGIGWISPDSVWSIPYFHPFGRPIRRYLGAIVHPGEFWVGPVTDPSVTYMAPISMTGTMKIEMTPLKRFQSPGPYTEFVSIEINLQQ